MQRSSSISGTRPPLQERQHRQAPGFEDYSYSTSSTLSPSSALSPLSHVLLTFTVPVPGGQKRNLTVVEDRRRRAGGCGFRGGRGDAMSSWAVVAVSPIGICRASPLPACRRRPSVTRYEVCTVWNHEATVPLQSSPSEPSCMSYEGVLLDCCFFLVSKPWYVLRLAHLASNSPHHRSRCEHPLFPAHHHPLHHDLDQGVASSCCGKSNSQIPLRRRVDNHSSFVVKEDSHGTLPLEAGSTSPSAPPPMSGPMLRRDLKPSGHFFKRPPPPPPPPPPPRSRSSSQGRECMQSLSQSRSIVR